MTKQEDYSYLIDKDKYQVFLFKSMACFPFLFAVHPWFVLNKEGELSRWEVGFSRKYKTEKSWGYLYKNRLSLFLGSESLPFIYKFFNKGELVGSVEGEIAQKMIDLIYDSPHTYTYSNKYRLWGPNSNTYVKWIIDNFPESGLKLPSNAYGKDFK
jgi:hypothetical protein